MNCDVQTDGAPCAPYQMPATTIAIHGKTNGASTFDKAALAGLSVIDMAQTKIWLDTSAGPHCHGVACYHYEQDPLLGKHPSLVRMALTGAVIDFGVLSIRSPFLRHLAIGIEAGNVTRNFTIGMHL